MIIEGLLASKSFGAEFFVRGEVPQTTSTSNRGLDANFHTTSDTTANSQSSPRVNGRITMKRNVNQLHKTSILTPSIIQILHYLPVWHALCWRPILAKPKDYHSRIRRIYQVVADDYSYGAQQYASNLQHTNKRIIFFLQFFFHPCVVHVCYKIKLHSISNQGNVRHESFCIFFFCVSRRCHSLESPIRFNPILWRNVPFRINFFFSRFFLG